MILRVLTFNLIVDENIIKCFQKKLYSQEHFQMSSEDHQPKVHGGDIQVQFGGESHDAADFSRSLECLSTIIPSNRKIPY